MTEAAAAPLGVRLARWREAGARVGDDVLQHPRFADAARAQSSNILSAAEVDAGLDGICKDVGRYAAATWAVALDAGDGLTLPRLKMLATRTGLVSPGRARAVLLYMRYLGYVVPAEDKGGGAVRYLPTAACIAATRKIHHVTLESAAAIEPAAREAAGRLADDAFLRVFLRIYGDGMAGAIAHVDIRHKAWDTVFHRHAGVQILHAMMLSAEPEADYPPRGPMRASASDLARRFKVSRTHVRRLLETGAANGVLARHADGTVTLTESGRAAMRVAFALRLAGTLWSAAAAAQETGV